MTDRETISRTMSQQLASHVHEPPVPDNIPTQAQAAEYVDEAGRLLTELCLALVKLRKGGADRRLHSVVMGFEDLANELRKHLSE